MGGQDKLAQFEQAVLPHLDAAYNLARWLTRQSDDAEDLAQEAYVRAFEAFDGFRGGDARAWILTIVRHTCYTWFKRNRSQELETSFDEEVHSSTSADSTPEAALLADADRETLMRALEELPVEFREALILRELEGLSYKEIAEVAGIPLGTVMSRLARARKLLERSLTGRISKEPER
ncbi:MAG TPA: sigma-70 family RNA polymerase sigma factor [Terriglobia bacterium]|nr:sigma-70 family RNA polymerase sigma factor [Terriglobia bacterium]